MILFRLSKFSIIILTYYFFNCWEIQWQKFGGVQKYKYCLKQVRHIFFYYFRYIYLWLHMTCSISLWDTPQCRYLSRALLGANDMRISNSFQFCSWICKILYQSAMPISTERPHARVSDMHGGHVSDTVSVNDHSLFVLTYVVFNIVCVSDTCPKWFLNDYSFVLHMWPLISYPLAKEIHFLFSFSHTCPCANLSFNIGWDE